MKDGGDGHAIILDYNVTTSSSKYWCDSVIVRNNILYEIKIVNTAVLTAGSGINLFTSSYAEVYNNVIYSSENGIHATGSRIQNTLIYNNTIVNVVHNGIVANSGVNLTVKNNIISGWGFKGIETGGGLVNFDASHNLFHNGSGGTPGTDNVFADPEFVNPANHDYRLQQSSPAIDTGTTITGLGYHNGRLTDIEGNSFPFNSIFHR